MNTRRLCLNWLGKLGNFTSTSIVELIQDFLDIRRSGLIALETNLMSVGFGRQVIRLDVGVLSISHSYLNSQLRSFSGPFDQISRLQKVSNRFRRTTMFAIIERQFLTLKDSSCCHVSSLCSFILVGCLVQAEGKRSICSIAIDTMMLWRLLLFSLIELDS